MAQTLFGNFVRMPLALLMISMALHSHAEAEQPKSPAIPPLEIKYRLIDLGETDVDPERLTRKSELPSLAPSINNAGQVIGNRIEGGFLRDPVIGEWVPYINNDVTINIHALSNHGDLLVTVNRKTNPPEWMVWPSSTGKNGPRERINLETFTNAKINFSGLTNNRMVLGNIIKNNKSQPVIWKPNQTVHFLINDSGDVVDGRATSINNHGQIAGFFLKQNEAPPSVWSQADGLQTLRHFRSQPVPQGEAELADILIAEDGTIYGTYRIKYKDSDKASDYYTYAWLPYEGGGFKLLDLDGMRLAALNDWHVLVGTHEGQAAICEPGQKPVQLCRLIKQGESKNWVLLEATGINNWGDIVGYGKYNGHMHVFLAEKINSHAPYTR